MWKVSRKVELVDSLLIAFRNYVVVPLPFGDLTKGVIEEYTSLVCLAVNLCTHLVNSK